MTNILKSQVSLEKEMSDMGQSRYRRDTHKAVQSNRESITVYGVGFLNAFVTPVAKRIVELIKMYEKGTPTPYPAPALACLKLLRPEVVATIALRVCVDNISTQKRIQYIILACASGVEDEWRLQNFKDINPALFGVIQRDLANKNCSYSRQKKTYIHSALKAEHDIGKLPIGLKRDLGALLVDIVMSSTGLFEAPLVATGRNRTPIKFQGTAKVLEWIKKKNSIYELLSPIKMPMVIPPKPWVSMFEGGYYNVALPMVKTDDQASVDAIEYKIKAGEMDEVLEGLNNIQQTPWRINKRIFETMEYYHDKQIDVGCLPPAQDVPAEAWVDGASKEEQRAWRRRSGKVKLENHRRRTKRLQFSQLMWMADKFKENDKIYFPHTLDFRGRTYASSSFLQPQAEETGRALLEFAEGKPLGNSGEPWLAVHGANCFGYDKASLEERVEWVWKNEEFIFKCSEDPLAFTFWQGADKPWQFLAFCFEWAVRGIAGFKSHIPVSIDGSANGIQHYSAMLRDKEGAKVVNLTPTDIPQDIYQIVADKIEAKLPEGHQWKGNVTRKLVKRPVMTTPYSAQLYGFRAQIEEELRKLVDKGEEFPFDELRKPSIDLANLTWDAIGEVVVAARGAMNFLQELVRIVCDHDNLAVYWTVPTGFLVKQRYRRSRSRRVKTYLNGKVKKLSWNADLTAVDKKKHSNSIAPNFIHSLDSCHLFKTVNASRKRGIRSFQVIHDSYGTHATDVEVLVEVVKDEFVRMYQDDVLGGFIKEIVAQLPPGTVLPERPPTGDFDINTVRDADFFFS